MRRIAIVGAGQSGLQLGLGLLAKGYEVTLLTNRTGEEIRNGKVTSSQCMFDMALATERELDIDFWQDSCPPVEGIAVNVCNPGAEGESLFSWSARLDKNAQSVDQRLKMPQWMNAFEAAGGDLQIADVGIDELETLTAEYDLVVLAAGKGEVVKQFERDDARSVFSAPQRALALTYVHGMTPMEPYSRVAFNLIPGVGEYFVFPAETLTGPCEIMVFEGIPGGPMDCWQDVKTPQEHLQRSLEILKRFVPWEYERCKNVTLTDDGGCIAGRFAPTVRKPVLMLPSGRKVLGMADALVVNDPITGQGANNAAKCSKVYLDAICERGDQAFDLSWMTGTFERYWDYAQHVVAWTNSLLTPPPPHILELLGAATQSESLASKIVNGFDDPTDYQPWWFDAEACQAEVARHMSAAPVADEA